MHPTPDQYVNIHAHRVSESADEWVLTNIRIGKNLPELSSQSHYSAGIHPWDVEERLVSDYIDKIRDLVTEKQVIALGEAGIDKAISTPLSLQSKVFQLHLSVASDYSMPVLIHAVKANQELIEEKKSFKGDVPMIIHGFTGGTQLAQSLLNAGFYLSVGENLKKSKKLREALPAIPLERLFLETDESGISIQEVYELASEIMEISHDEIMEHMAGKTNNLFFNR